eukprot:CAMPEP_0206425882 /NCGR_PEP_ID=MMETSP0324_2-20121206/4053_1 /ASSEMBLY_ACC=CAM_ASM_000836 /TAXON_ID=2866 /ORGANISM="Crypthecodinium cohnii, Strain Seligo" /LENGTH=221 /DNA_ID=CAMNT_0053890743 /DNA_START=168 /DNA_END=830 /DNA_ORIENTATION=-
MSKDDIDMADASPEELRSTLKATLEVVQAQRAKLEELQGELSEVRRQLAEESAAAHRNEELRFEAEAALTHEKAAREATEETLRATSVDFARKLAAMQAKVMEAERDVVLGGQVIMVPLTSAPSSAAGSSSGVGSACNTANLVFLGRWRRQSAKSNGFGRSDQAFLWSSDHQWSLWWICMPKATSARPPQYAAQSALLTPAAIGPSASTYGNLCLCLCLCC